jgi:hypothetical protein
MIRKEYEYRRNAIASVELARRAASPADKAHLLKLAEAWLQLAKVTHRQSGQHFRKIGEHPLAGLSSGPNGQRDCSALALEPAGRLSLPSPLRIPAPSP